MSGEENQQLGENQVESVARKANIILIGAMGSGKSTVGACLALKVGYGFIDTDDSIERLNKKSVAEIFDSDGEAKFREMECDLISTISGIKSHVISVGGGSVLDDGNWDVFKKIGNIVWLKTPSTEVARRFLMSPDDIRSRPLIKDLVNVEDRADRQQQLIGRLDALVAQRLEKYSQAEFVVEDSYSTPETTTRFLMRTLSKSGVLVT